VKQEQQQQVKQVQLQQVNQEKLQQALFTKQFVDVQRALALGISALKTFSATGKS
jgi:hypothetical protein